MARAHLALAMSAVLFGKAICWAGQASAQTPSAALLPEAPALSSTQYRELAEWLSALQEWRRYDAKWHNRPVRDGWGRIVARQPPPSPPVWLEAHCDSLAAAGVLELEEHVGDACRLLADPRAQTNVLADARQASRLEAENPPRRRSRFLRRVHLDGLWTTTSTSGRFYGIVGSHVTLVDVGRLQIFGPPGVMLLTVPDGHDSRRLTLGYTWGVSVRLGDVRLLAPTKNMTLYLNVTKVWINDGNDRGRFGAFDIAGFSLAPRRAP